MYPSATVRRESRLHVATIDAQALSEFVPVISAPEQLGDLARKKKQQPERIEKIVEEPDHSACAHFGGSPSALQEQHFGGAVGSRPSNVPQWRWRHPLRETLLQDKDPGER